MKNFLEAKELAHDILLDIEKNGKDLHLLCLQTARLSLLLNNTESSEKFSDYARECSEKEAFLLSYGRIIGELIKKIDLDSLYKTDEDPPLYEDLIKQNTYILSSLRSNMLSGQKRDPKKDIEKYYIYKENINDIKTAIYEYAMNVYYQLNFSENISDILSEYRVVVDNKLPNILPNSKEKLNAITKNLISENKEDWSNAVHTCRKLLQDFADILYPPSKIQLQKNGKTIKLDETSYINRLIVYIDENSDSKKFKKITGSSLEYIGNRLDAIYEASNKGTHETISSLQEAKMYVIYTYLFIGDVLSLK